jgi:3-hydroxyisobutyrate dehydrogenase
MRLGFVGVGDLGGAMALMIERAGFELAVWARRPESLEHFAGTSAQFVPTLAELGRQVDVVCICVFDDAGIRSVLFENGLSEGLRAGSTVVIHSTVSPSVCIEAASMLATLGIDVLDAPIGGGPHHAFARRVTVMVGGEAEVLERVRPVFDSYAASVHHLGGVGAGQRTKIVNNVLHLVNTLNSLRALDTLESFGIDREAARGVLVKSSGGSFGLDETVPRLGGIALPHFIQLMRKEVTLFGSIVAPDDAGAAALTATAEDAIRYLEELDAVTMSQR